jgi:hypothetical protein
MMNRKINKNTPFGLKGVRQLGKRYQARITLDQKTEYLGCYPTPEEAARAYDLAAVQFFGAFARLNFPSWAGEK